MLDLAPGHFPFGNADTEYTLGTPVIPPQVVSPLIAAANAGVGRFTMAPSAGNYVEHHLTPTGDLRIPVLTLDNTWEPALPAFHETALLQAAQVKGATGNLLQRFVPTFGHCDIPAGVVAQAFANLVGWVATGVKPAS